MFTSSDVRERVKRKPFVPVRFLMSNGDAYDAWRPDLVMVGQRELMIGTTSKRDPSTYDAVARLSILHLAAIQDLTVPTPPKQNGSER